MRALLLVALSSQYHAFLNATTATLHHITILSSHRTAMQLALHGGAFSFHSLSKSLSFISKSLSFISKALRHPNYGTYDS